MTELRRFLTAQCTHVYSVRGAASEGALAPLPASRFLCRARTAIPAARWPRRKQVSNDEKSPRALWSLATGRQPDSITTHTHKHTAATSTRMMGLARPGAGCAVAATEMVRQAVGAAAAAAAGFLQWARWSAAGAPTVVTVVDA